LTPYGIAAVALALLLFAVRAHYYGPWNIDDPWISYRYAGNLAHGHGLVFNPGDPVEAYSNFLWTVIAAVGIKGGLAAESFMPLLGALCGAAMVLFLATRHTSAEAGAWRGRLAAMAVAVSAPLAYWAPSGLETPFFALLLFMGGWRAGQALRQPSALRWWEAWAWLTAMALARIEGPMFCVVVAAFGLAAYRTMPPAARRGCVAGGVASLLVQGTYHAWRFSFFGKLFPNSYTAKATGGLVAQVTQGAIYVVEGFILDMPLITALLLAGSVAWLLQRRSRGYVSPPPLALPPPLAPHVPLFAALAGAQVFFAVYVGGDWMYFSRFLAPAVPLLAVLAQDAFQLLWWRLAARDATHARRDALAVACASLVLLGWFGEWRQAGAMMRVLREHRLVDPVLELAHWMRVALPPTATLAAEEAGYLPYYTGMRFLDMLGLTTPAVAEMPGPLHFKTNTPWLLAQRPDFVLLLAVPHLSEFHHPIDKAYPASRSMLLESEFRENYRPILMQSRGTHVFGRLTMFLYGRVRPGESVKSDLPYPVDPAPVP